MGRGGFEPPTFAVNHETKCEVLRDKIPRFADWLRVDEVKSKRTVQDYTQKIRFILNHIPSFDYGKIREFLKSLQEQRSPETYSSYLKALKNFTRFLGCPQLVSSYKFPRSPFQPKPIWSKQDLKTFYEALPTLRMKTYFLITASSGLRKNEVLELKFADIDFNKRMIIPKGHIGNSKHSWVSFYNEEAEEVLRKYLDLMTVFQKSKGKLFPISSRDFQLEWKEARVRTGLQIKVKDLRDWFCQEMGELGVSDRFIDAFCGRTPKSILARHYSDYSPERLKRIYDQAGLKVLL